MAGRIKSQVIYFTLIILLISSVIFPTSSRAGHPGETIFDLEMDVPIAHIDVIKIETMLNGQTLAVRFFLRDVPSGLTFDRIGVPENQMEYKWAVHIDIDNDQETDYSISASHFSFETNPIIKPISEGVQVNTWRHVDHSLIYFAPAFIYVDSQLNTITLIGNIPGISTESILSFELFDWNPDGDPVNDYIGSGDDVIDEIVMELDAGCNMISLPVSPASPVLFDLFPEAVVVYGYEKGAGYVRIKDEEALKVGKGYWILFNQGKTCILRGQPILDYTHIADEDGWAMIGGCTLPSKALSENCSIVVIYGYAPGVGYQRVHESEDLEPGKGYWILLRNVSYKAGLLVDTKGF